MKKTILLAALGLISLSALAKDKPQEEGFVFTTVKENPFEHLLELLKSRFSRIGIAPHRKG